MSVTTVKVGARVSEVGCMKIPTRVTDLSLFVQDFLRFSPESPLSPGQILQLLTLLLTQVPGDNSFHCIPFVTLKIVLYM